MKEKALVGLQRNHIQEPQKAKMKAKMKDQEVMVRLHDHRITEQKIQIGEPQKVIPRKSGGSHHHRMLGGTEGIHKQVLKNYPSWPFICV